MRQNSSLRVVTSRVGSASVRGANVPRPAAQAFAVAANAAFNATLSPSFTPYGDDVLFYHGAFIFEDVGVTAYKVRSYRKDRPALCRR